MASPYKNVLMIGGTTGIGAGMTAKLLANGSSVIITGRKEVTLIDAVASHNTSKVSYAVLNLEDMGTIPAFATKMFEQHPDIDCVWLNAGVQVPFNDMLAGKTDMQKVQTETTVNYTAQVALTQAVLPYIKDKDGSALIYTSSGLAYLPFPKIATYSASKTALHFYTMCLRDSMKRAKSPCLVAEVYPPVVQTELHGPEGRKMGMSLNDFVEQAWPGVVNKLENWVVGKNLSPDGFFEEVEMKRINTLSEALDKMGGPAP